MSRNSEDEQKRKTFAEDHAGDDYEADEFEAPAVEEHKEGGAGPVIGDASYEHEPFASASEEEEEVFSTADAHLPPKGLELMNQRAAAAVSASGAAVPRRHPQGTGASSSSAAAAAKTSSLPSLGGLPAIGAMSLNLTAAGRAHFGNPQATSLFGKAAPAPSARGKPTHAAASPPANDSTVSHAALASYAAWNRLNASEYLGIHALQVRPSAGVDEVPAASSGGTVELDGGKLRIWCGAMENSDMGNAAGENGAANGGEAAGGFKLPSGVFLRASLVPGAGASPPLHISVDNSDPLSLSPGDAATSSAVDVDGAPSAEVHSCFHAHRVGPYRLRIVARGSVMPQAPDSFNTFVSRVAAAQTAAEESKTNFTAAAIATAEQSPFDIQPQPTLYVAVEKLVSDAGTGAGGSKSLTPAALPLLPVGDTHTFWLSTHQSSALSASAGEVGAASQTTLLFADPADPSNDHLELNLTVHPLHARILEELAIFEQELDDRDKESDEEDNDATSPSAAGTAAAATSRKGKKKQKCNAKKRSKNKRQQQNEEQASQPAPAPQLVSVSIVAANNDAASLSEGVPPPLVSISFSPSSAAEAVAPPPAHSPAVDAVQPPSLVDLLATLVVSPSTSLPTSILGAGQSVAQVAEQTYARSTGGAAAAAVASSNASLPAIGSSSAASATAVPSSGAFDPLLSSLDRRVTWPFAVSIDALRVSEECEGHASVSDSLVMDRMHNRALTKPRSAAGAGARGKKSSSAASTAPDSMQTFFVGDHEVSLLRSVGLLCSWASPRDGSLLNRPVLVSQQPLLSFHVQCSIRRLEPEEANARAMEAVLDF